MDRKVSYEHLVVLAALVLGLLLRLVPARNSVVEGDIVFYDYDTFYHLRRILYTVENFPHTLWFDSYLNHPYGLELTWPPLFDQIIAAGALLLGGSPRAVEIAGAVIPPILGSAMIVLIYLLSKKLFGMKVALLSAFLLATDPKHIARTHFACVDHDALESLLILGVIILLVYALNDRHRSLRFAVPAGILIAATAYTWLGTTAYMGAIFIYAAVQIALDLRNGDSPGEAVFPLITAFGVALMLILPFWDRAWLMPSFFGALGTLLCLSFLYLLSRLFVAKRVPWPAFIPAMAISACIALITIHIFIPYRGIRYLQIGLQYFFSGDLAQLGIEEAMPIYKIYDLVSIHSLSFAFILLGLAVLIQLTFRSGLPRDRVLFLVWAAFSLILAFFQVRFLFILSVTGSVMISMLFFWVVERVRSSEWIDPAAVKPLSLVLLSILLYPNVVGVVEIAERSPNIAGDWIDTLDWIGENTPPTEGFERPVRAGEYGILSWWSYGNWVLYQSRRPVVANNFQAGAVDAARFLLSESEEDGLETIQTREVRYIIVSFREVCIKLPLIARWIDSDPKKYLRISADSDEATVEYSELFRRTILSSLYFLDCTNLDHFRLIYESKTSAGINFPVSEVKVFERVVGAKITGTTPDDKPLRAILEMTSNQGRRFQYLNSAMPVDGRYEITVPYSTVDRYGTHSVGPYILGPVEDVAGSENKEVEVSEEDVLQGRLIEVNF